MSWVGGTCFCLFLFYTSLFLSFHQQYYTEHPGMEWMFVWHTGICRLLFHLVMKCVHQTVYGDLLMFLGILKKCRQEIF